MKLVTNIRHVSGYYCTGFESQRLKVRIMTRPINLQQYTVYK